jgi:hypothetical protein
MFKILTDYFFAGKTKKFYCNTHKIYEWMNGENSREKRWNNVEELIKWSFGKK